MEMPAAVTAAILDKTGLDPRIHAASGVLEAELAGAMAEYVLVQKLSKFGNEVGDDPDQAQVFIDLDFPDFGTAHVVTNHTPTDCSLAPGSVLATARHLDRVLVRAAPDASKTLVAVRAECLKVEETIRLVTMRRAGPWTTLASSVAVVSAESNIDPSAVKRFHVEWRESVVREIRRHLRAALDEIETGIFYGRDNTPALSHVRSTLELCNLVMEDTIHGVVAANIEAFVGLFKEFARVHVGFGGSDISSISSRSSFSSTASGGSATSSGGGASSIRSAGSRLRSDGGRRSPHASDAGSVGADQSDGIGLSASKRRLPAPPTLVIARDDDDETDDQAATSGSARRRTGIFLWEMIFVPIDRVLFGGVLWRRREKRGGGSEFVSGIS